MKEFLYVKEELFNEPVRIEDYISEAIKKVNGKDISKILDDIFESGSVLNSEMPDIIGFLNRYIELCEENGNRDPLIHKILGNTGSTRKLVKAFIYETGQWLAANNGISSGDTITEYDFGKMLLEELKDSEMTGFFPYEFEDLKKRLGL